MHHPAPTRPLLQGRLRAATLVLCLATTAVAQAQQPPVAASPPASAPATTLQTVTVTGERASRTIAETTSSVSVLPEAEVRRKGGKEGVYQALEGLPNLTPAAPEELPSIRGEKSSGAAGLGGGFLIGTQPRASLIVDDVPRISSIANNSFQSIFDVEQIELLRGPQTTLRGANAIAGAFIVKTKDPVARTEGELFTLADHNKVSGLGWRIAGMGNAPLGDALAARVVVERRKGRVPIQIIDASGFDPNFPTPPPGTDLDALSDFDNTSLRAKFLFAPPRVPELDLLFTVQAERGTDVGFDSYANGIATIGRPLEERSYQFGNQRIFDTRAQLFSINAGWQLRAGGELRLIASTQRDHFQDNPKANEFVRFKEFDESFSALDLLYTFGRNKGAASGVLGATVSRRKQDALTTQFDARNNQRSDSSALFADVAVPFGAWQLLAGARLHRERSERSFELGGAPPIDERISENEFLPKLGVGLELGPGHTAALTWRRGYNPGGSGIDFLSLEPYFFVSERVDAVELAWRWAPKDGALALAANLFHNAFEDKQFPFSPVPGSFRVVNQPKSRSRGLELEAQWQVSPALRADAGIGLLRTRVVEGDPALVGNKFGEDPRTTLSLGLLWTPLPALELNARVRRVGGYYSDFQNAESDRGGDYTIVDLGASFTRGAWTLRGFVNNATDKLALATGCCDGGGYLLPPRVVGVSANVRF